MTTATPATVSAPITAIRPGDTLVTGYGTLNIVAHLVTEVETISRPNYYVKVRCADGYTLTDTPSGFWYQIAKADPAAQAAAGQAAVAYAAAWDNRR
jgi:hypothetical protein